MIHGGLSLSLASYHLGGSGIIPPEHKIFQLSTLAPHQKLGGCVIQPGLPELAYCRTEFEQFGTQLQDLQDFIGHPAGTR
jgi:hypothetical protein